MKRLSSLVMCGLLLVAAACAGDEASQSGASPDASPPPQSPASTEPAGNSPLCSAAALSEDEPEPPGLPAEVAMMRKEILKAAVNCDYELLQALALRPNGSFQYSRNEESAGTQAQPGAFWRAQEEAGREPLAELVQLLNSAPEVRQVAEEEGPGTGSEDTYYRWRSTNPSGGYETIITSTGDWIVFLPAA